MPDKHAETAAHAVPEMLLNSPYFQLERLRRHTRAAVEAQLATEETSVREYWALTCLTDTGSQNQSALAETLLIDPSDIVRIVDQLENHGWVGRRRDPKDRRRQVVSATKKGRKAQPRLAELVAKAEEAALDESTSKQLKQLRKLAGTVIQETNPA